MTKTRNGLGSFFLGKGNFRDRSTTDVLASLCEQVGWLVQIQVFTCRGWPDTLGKQLQFK